MAEESGSHQQSELQASQEGHRSIHLRSNQENKNRVVEMIVFAHSNTSKDSSLTSQEILASEDQEQFKNSNTKQRRIENVSSTTLTRPFQQLSLNL